MKIKRIFVICLIIFLTASVTAFSQEGDPPSDPNVPPKGLEALQDAGKSFSEKLAQSLPFNSTIGLNWSDAYIGQLLGVPPRFGVGLTVGTTLIPLDEMSALFEMFDFDLPVKNFPIGLPLPSYTAEARIGGLILPFDLGVKFGYIPSFNIPYVDIGVRHLILGADLRYSLLPKNTPILKLSIGVGYNYLNGGLSRDINLDIAPFEFDDDITGKKYSLSIENPNVALNWQTHCFEAKAQASFFLILFTPYIGAGFSYAKSEAGYHVNTKVSVKEGDIEMDELSEEVIELMSALGLGNISDNGFGAVFPIEGYNVRVYGGVCFNIAMAKIDLTLMYNIFSKSIGGTIGVRAQF